MSIGDSIAILEGAENAPLSIRLCNFCVWTKCPMCPGQCTGKERGRSRRSEVPSSKMVMIDNGPLCETVNIGSGDALIPISGNAIGGEGIEDNHGDIFWLSCERGKGFEKSG